jgi:hypothetical protein
MTLLSGDTADISVGRLYLIVIAWPIEPSDEKFNASFKIFYLTKITATASVELMTFSLVGIIQQLKIIASLD